MELEALKKVMDAFHESDYRVLELEEGDVSLKLKRVSGRGKHIPERNAVVKASPETFQKTEPDAREDDGVCVVRAAMAGTFYTSPKPGDPPYVSAGSAVRKGDTLGLLEAMKLMSEITAPEDGTVEEVLIGDAEFVEFETPLFHIRKTGTQN